MAYTTIDDPSKHFQVLTYRGDSSSTTTADRTLTNEGTSDLQPDLIGIWNRDSVTNSGARWWDSTRGVGENKGLTSSGSNAEGGPNDPEYGYVNTLNSDGFGVRAGANDGNGRYTTDRGEGGGDKYVAWQWKANGGTTSTSTVTGGIDAGTQQANTTSKFSIVGYTSESSQAVGTVTHGLGVAPELMIVKRRPQTDNWAVYHHKNTAAPETDVLSLNTTAATTDHDGPWNDTAPTSSVFTLGTISDTNEGSGVTYIAYLWAGVQGYSKFGTYEGNGNANGMYIVTGFKPAFVMTKSIDSTSSWNIFDHKREGYNVDNDPLEADSTATEATTDMIDFYSNGFKLITTTDPNVAETYVYAAFAEQPFVSSGGVPATAR